MKISNHIKSLYRSPLNRQTEKEHNVLFLFSKIRKLKQIRVYLLKITKMLSKSRGLLFLFLQASSLDPPVLFFQLAANFPSGSNNRRMRYAKQCGSREGDSLQILWLPQMTGQNQSLPGYLAPTITRQSSNRGQDFFFCTMAPIHQFISEKLQGTRHGVNVRRTNSDVI